MSNSGISNVRTQNDLWKMAIDRGAVLCVDYHVCYQGRWMKFSSAFFDTATPDADGCYHEVGSFSCDLNRFTPQDRMASEEFVKTDPDAHHAYKHGAISQKGLHLVNQEFATYRKQLEVEKNNPRSEYDSGEFSM